MSTSDLLQCVEVNPSSEADAAVIWLHGLGADGHDFEPIVPELQLPANSAVRFVFPHAPERPVTINGGMRMRAWYDILELSFDARTDLNHVLESAEQVEALVRREIERGIAPERLVLAGFSQGGTIAMQAALQLDVKLAGLLALSTWLPRDPVLSGHYRKTNLETPVFMAHGSVDPVIPMRMGILARESLRELGMDVVWNEYMMEHGVCIEEIRDIGNWLGTCLPG